MAETTFMVVPRRWIPWTPTIAYAKCDFCTECAEFRHDRVSNTGEVTSSWWGRSWPATDSTSREIRSLGTEKHGGPVAQALVMADILGPGAAPCSRFRGTRTEAGGKAVAAVADPIAAEVDALLAASPGSSSRGARAGEDRSSAQRYKE